VSIAVPPTAPAEAPEEAAAARPAYASKIIKAGALLGDTRTLFALWEPEQSIVDNLDRFRRQNLLGKTSRKRAEDELAIFRQRYLGDLATARALASLTQGGLPEVALDRIYYFYAAQADRLLHDVVVELLARPGRPSEVTTPEVQRFIQGLTRDPATGRQPWSEATSERIAQGLLATLRDFGVLTGAAQKRLAAMHLPVEAFAYVAFLLSPREGRAVGLVNSAEWRLFLLQPAAVERLFIEAQGRHLLTYHAAGSIVRIDFPVDRPVDWPPAGAELPQPQSQGHPHPLEDYARALVEGAH
jgi:hypothetical protein